MVTPGIQRGNAKQTKLLASPKDAGTSGEAAGDSGETPGQQGQGSRGPGTGGWVRAGWKPLTLGKWPAASEWPSRLKPCHPGTVGSMRDSHHGASQPLRACKLSNHLWLPLLHCGQGASWWELIANYHLEESGCFIFLLSSVPHSLLSPMFNFLDIHLEGKNDILICGGFGVSSLDVAIKYLEM